MDIKERFYSKLNEAREQLDELTGYRKKKLFGKDPIGAVSKRAVDRMKVMPKNEKEKAQNAKSSKILRWAADRSDERPLDEEQLNELRGKGTLDKKDKEELKDRIYKKHGKAWNDTKEKRKALGSKGSADTKDMDKFRNRLGAMHNKLEEEQLNEKAKWRKTKVAKKITDPQGYDSVSYDYHSDNPRSTGMMKATSDKPYSHGSLMTRGKAKITSKGKVTKSSADKLKDKIKANLKK